MAQVLGTVGWRGKSQNSKGFESLLGSFRSKTKRAAFWQPFLSKYLPVNSERQGVFPCDGAHELTGYFNSAEAAKG
jgi:hypothetical protein